MKLITGTIAAAAALTTVAYAQNMTMNVTVTYDNAYDNKAGSMDSTACSNGPHGLSKSFPTFGSAPGFPNIGGAGVIKSFDSALCGSCWQLTYDNNPPIFVFAIDHADAGTFNIAQEAMDTLTGGFAVFLGRVNATAVQVDPKQRCEVGSKGSKGHGHSGEN